MSFKRELIAVMREIRNEISGLRVALAETQTDTRHRLDILEAESARHERLITEELARTK